VIRIRTVAAGIVVVLAILALTGCARDTAGRTARALDSSYFGGSDLWAEAEGQGTSWDTGVPSSMEASSAFIEIAKQLPGRGEAFNVISLSGQWRAYGDEALLETSRTAPFRIVRVAEIATLSPSSADSVWARLQTTGDYSVLLRSGSLATGFIARRDPDTGTWKAAPDERRSNDFPYLRALDAAGRRGRDFEVRILVAAKEPATDWFVFRFADGSESASPVFLIPNWTWNAAGAPVKDGDLYPADFVFRPVLPD